MSTNEEKLTLTSCMSRWAKENPGEAFQDFFDFSHFGLAPSSGIALTYALYCDRMKLSRRLRQALRSGSQEQMLLELCDEPDEDLRRNAMRGLLPFNPGELVKFLKHDHPQIASAARARLCQTPVEDWGLTRS